MNKIMRRLERVVGDLGELNFVGNDLAPNYFTMIFNESGNKDLLVKRIKADNAKPIITYEWTDENAVAFFVYGKNSPAYWGKD